jgi:hypothetical protein
MNEVVTPYLAVAGTQTLSGASISEFESSVSIFTRWKPSFFFGTAAEDDIHGVS